MACAKQVSVPPNNTHSMQQKYTIPVLDLPDYIVVETEYVRRPKPRSSQDKNPTDMSSSNQAPNVANNSPAKLVSSPSKPECSTSSTALQLDSVKCEQKQSSVIVPQDAKRTLSKARLCRPITKPALFSLPTRERETQTSVVMVEAGVQGQLDEEWECIEINPRAEVDEKQRRCAQEFSEYIGKHTLEYPNKFTECLICGEVTRTAAGIRPHMAAHYGPKVLCADCGKLMENEHALVRHLCSVKIVRTRCRLKCPIYECPLSLISRLEMFDHINEHIFMPRYQCTACKHTYPTLEELRHHSKLRRSCQANFRLKDFLNFSRSEDLCYRRRVSTVRHKGKKYVIKRLAFRERSKTVCRLCSYCLKRFKCANGFVYHRKRCARAHARRVRLARKQVFKLP